MTPMDRARRVLVVGNGMAGARFAEDLRQRDPRADRFAITIVGEEAHPAYNRVLLSTVVSGRLAARETRLKPDGWWTARQIDVVTGATVTAIDTEQRTATLDSGGDSAQFDIGRGFVVGQVPFERFVPFARVGGGVIRAKSDRLGKDTDFMLITGIGAKVAVSKVFTPRLDLQLDMTQKVGGGFSEGIALHPEILLGIDFTLNR